MVPYHVIHHDPQAFSVAWNFRDPLQVGAPYEVPADANALMLSVSGDLGGAVHALESSHDATDWIAALDTGGNPIRSQNVGRVHVAPGAKFLRPVVEKGETTLTTFTLSVSTP